MENAVVKETDLPGTAIAEGHSLELIRDKETGKPKDLLWWHFALDPIGCPLDPGDPCHASAIKHELYVRGYEWVSFSKLSEDKLKDLCLQPSIACRLCGAHVFIDDNSLLPCTGPLRGGYIERY